MQLKFASSVAVALLILMGATASRAEKRKKKSAQSTTEVPANVNKQFEWENKVVGPKEGINKEHLAAVQEQGRREDAERKKQPKKKPGRAAGIDAAGSVALPTMAIEEPSTPSHKTKKVAASAPRHKDSLDNLLDAEGVKADNPSGGQTDTNVMPSSSAKKSRKHRR